MQKMISLLISLAVLSGCVSQSEIRRSTKSAQVHTELAGLYFGRAQAGVALEEIGFALKADSDYGPAYGMRGLIHMSLREDKEAERDFKKSLRLDKTDSKTQNNYGWFLCQRGREKESIPHFMAALKNPLYVSPGRAYLNAGLCSKKSGNTQDAEEFLQNALLVQPGMSQALWAMTELSYTKGDYATAKKYFARYATDNSNLTAEHLLLAVRIEHKVGDRNSEASYRMQLRNRFPDARETKSLEQGK